MRKGTRIKIGKKWTAISMTPECYAELTGHSQGYVRRCFLPEETRNDPEAMIRFRISTEDLIDDIYDVRLSRKEESD